MTTIKAPKPPFAKDILHELPASLGKACLAIAQVSQVVPNEGARVPAYLLHLDVERPLLDEHQQQYGKSCYKSSAQLCSRYQKEDLEGKQLLCVINFPRKQIGPRKSDCLVTGVQDTSLDGEEKRKTTTTLEPTSEVANGAKVSPLALSGIYEHNPRDLSWDEFAGLAFVVATIKRKKSTLYEDESLVWSALELGIGEKHAQGVACLAQGTSLDTWIGGQYLFYYDKKRELYHLCSIEGSVLLRPSLPVQDGFRLA